MRRFILKENIVRFERLLSREDLDEVQQAMVKSLRDSMRRELALLEADRIGASSYPRPFVRQRRRENSMHQRRTFRDLIEGSSQAYLVVDPRSGLHIVDMNDAYSAATMTVRDRVAGERLFAVFPDNPETPEADGVANVYGILQRVAETGRPQALADLRYDIRNPGGQFVKRYWRADYEPVFDDEGDISHLLVRAADLTADHLGSQPI